MMSNSRSGAEKWLGEQGYAELAVSEDELTIRTAPGEAGWFVYVCEDLHSPQEYLYVFDTAIDTMIRNGQSANGDRNLAVALAFGSTLRGEQLSYRKAMKKYSRSVIFQEVGIHLLLIHDDGLAQVIPPDDVNAFLTQLNQLVGRTKSKSGADNQH